MSEISRLAPVLLEALKREGKRGHRGQLSIENREAGEALVRLFKFCSRHVSIYTSDHEIVVKQSSHVS